MNQAAKRSGFSTGSNADYGRENTGNDSGRRYTQRRWNDPDFDKNWDPGEVTNLSVHRRPVPEKPKEVRADLTLTERLIGQAMKEKGAVIVCAVFLVLNVLMASVFLGRANKVRITRENIAVREQGIEQTQADIETQSALLAGKQDETAVRNKAINELGMIRLDTSHRKSVHIQTPEEHTLTSGKDSGETKFSLLDILLSLLDVFHIGN